MTRRIRLGDITVPSGDLIVIDGGYLGVWSGDRSPSDIDPAVLGIDDPTTAADIRGAVDFEITGRDAAAASEFLRDQPQALSLYDVPASSAAQFREAFASLCLEGGIEASLVATARVPHRERARRVGAGGGFQAFGVPVVAANGLPTDRPLPIEAVDAQPADSDSGGLWESIAVTISDAPVATSQRLGEVGVDWARLAFADADAIGSWEHDNPIDGLADVAFWGQSEVDAAAAQDAPLLTTPGEAGVYGWVDLPLAAAAERARAVLAWAEADPGRKLMVDFRPHSHHWAVMRQVRAAKTGSGTVEVAGARILFAMTGRGDGFFPVYADHAADGTLAAIRVDLH